MGTPRRALRPPWVTALLAVLVALGLTTVTGPAQAAASRGWSLFQLSGATWQRAAQGAATVPADGSVIGWRFALAADGSTRTPRGSLTFAAVCGKTAAESGRKRVAVVIDYGRRVDYDAQGQPPVPRADCASVPTAATAAAALADVARTRDEDGKVCAVDDFPQSSCGEQVADAEVPSAATMPDAGTSVALPAAATADDDPREGGLPFLAWAGLVIVLAGGGLALLLRRRRHADSSPPRDGGPDSGPGGGIVPVETAPDQR